MPPTGPRSPPSASAIRPTPRAAFAPSSPASPTRRTPPPPAPRSPAAIGSGSDLAVVLPARVLRGPDAGRAVLVLGGGEGLELAGPGHLLDVAVRAAEVLAPELAERRAVLPLLEGIAPVALPDRHRPRAHDEIDRRLGHLTAE